MAFEKFDATPTLMQLKRCRDKSSAFLIRLILRAE
jgi:hypothetical protein